MNELTTAERPAATAELPHLLREPEPLAEYTGKPPKLLALDGGGVRGLIPALILAEVEERTGRRTAELFDLISGTSTGGIIACFLALPGEDGSPGRPASEVVRFYTEQCPKIFHASRARKVTTLGGVLNEKFNAEQLESSLKLALGEARLSDAATDLLVTAYDIEGRRPFFFKSSRAKMSGARDYPMWLVARCTSAAPTFFEPVEIKHGEDHIHALIDGGVNVNNPSMCAYAEVCSGKASHALLVSLGTGRTTMPMPIADAKHWGLAHWARPLLTIVFDGVSDIVDYQLDQLLGNRHVRLQASLDGASEAFDDATEENMDALKRQARKLIEDKDAEIDALCEALVA